MNSPRFGSFILCACLGATSGMFAADSSAELTPAPSERALPSAIVPDQYIVQVVAGVNPRTVAATFGISPRHVYEHAVRGFAGYIPPGRLAAVRADARVVHVTPDRKVAAIGKPSGGGGGAAQVTPAGVEHIGAAPGVVAYSGAGIGVAVVDTGVDFNHADLQPLASASFSAFGSSALDNNGHGTHVAGTIAARNNSIDVVGVAPAATIYAVKVLDAAGSGSDATVIAGLDWVAAANTGPLAVIPRIRVVNMSLGRAGTLDDNSTLRASVAALRDSGVAVVVAAGNDATLEVSQQVPSTYPEVIAIASTTAKDGTNQYRFFSGVIKADTASYFTSDGAFDPETVIGVNGIGVTVSGPGEDQENISKAGFLKSVGILSTKLAGGTTRMSGTSMAAPHAAGVAALVFQQNSTLGAEDIRDRLSAGATNAGTTPLDSPTSGYTYDGAREGVLNAPGALAAPPPAP
ncbi:MAG: S8 family serine peptidase [Opitutaceae bacterium]|nr:S8 family serine peptidase [Opitutaceae bacterium]